ncbi:hypothetical protein [Streptomyces coffeae]|uniref:M20/M25/M40 family metallo-hydrolase n=1 Tax=Streptomyces coffeae TaxID=621382 RepID=A0ABS1NNY6_9ACTN|nr:hypothetical protein [Streptomyces coffeae]MBL1101728.1 hypothetical protein [Streptomyces coffeae]
MSSVEKDSQLNCLLAVLDGLRESMTASLQELVRIPSVNPKYPGVEYKDHVGRESEATAMLADLYSRAGASVDVFAVEEGRCNAVGRISGRGTGKSLVFNGHVDVVPAGDPSEWTKAALFSGEVIGSRMYGRGIRRRLVFRVPS